MADSTIKPDSGNDLVLQNNGGTGKIEVNDGGDITVTLGGSTGDDLNIDSNTLVVESDTNSVGFGTNDPAQQVHISGAAPIIQLTDTDTGADSLITASNATGSLKIQCDNNNETGSSTFEVDIDGSQRMKVDSTGDITITDGDLVIGTAGKGIDFSAGSTSNGITGEVLEHVETGTFDPLLNGIAISGAGTYSNYGGFYTIVGNQITATFQVTYDGAYANIGTNQVYMTLPATALNSGNYTSIASMSYTSTSGASGAYNLLGRIQTNSTSLYFFLLGGARTDFLSYALTGHNTDSSDSVLTLAGTINYIIN
jgi:hypothetical protein